MKSEKKFLIACQVKDTLVKLSYITLMKDGSISFGIYTRKIKNDGLHITYHPAKPPKFCDQVSMVVNNNTKERMVAITRLDLILPIEMEYEFAKAITSEIKDLEMVKQNDYKKNEILIVKAERDDLSALILLDFLHPTVETNGGIAMLWHNVKIRLNINFVEPTTEQLVLLHKC